MDQWHFTTDTTLEASLNRQGNAGYSTPLPLSPAPFNTAVRLRSLFARKLDNLENPQASNVQNVTAWLPSSSIRASGKFNYEIIESDEYGISGVTFSDGLSIEYWQIGGSSNHFATWDYAFPSTSIGTAFKSADFGQSYDLF